jgi:RNA polymerase sigma factor (sigma-70 family)
MEFLAEAAQLARLERFGLDAEDFGHALQQSVERYAPGAAGRELREFVLSLRLEDLALAAACARGIETAWDEFHRTYRQYLVNATADAEVADQIIAELYGVEGSGRIRDFRGRSSLKGWLRAIVYQAQVDRHRRESRFTELDPESAREAAPPGRDEHPEDFERRENAAALARLLGREVAALAPAERLLLGWYYQDRLRLSQIARLRGVHESTISREVDAIRKQLRKRVEKALRAAGFSAARIEECFRHSTDAPVDLEEVFGRARNAG